MKNTAPPSSRTEEDAVMDVEDALQRLGDDQELFREIVQIYVEDSPDMVRAIHAAVDDANPAALQRAAHSLKGLTATLSAGEASRAASRLEQMGAAGDMEDVHSALEQIDRRIAELNEAVQQYLRRH